MFVYVDTFIQFILWLYSKHKDMNLSLLGIVLLVSFLYFIGTGPVFVIPVVDSRSQLIA